MGALFTGVMGDIGMYAWFIGDRDVLNGICGVCGVCGVCCVLCVCMLGGVSVRCGAGVTHNSLAVIGVLGGVGVGGIAGVDQSALVAGGVLGGVGVGGIEV